MHSIHWIKHEVCLGKDIAKVRRGADGKWHGIVDAISVFLCAQRVVGMWKWSNVNLCITAPNRITDCLPRHFIASTVFSSMEVEDIVVVVFVSWKLNCLERLACRCPPSMNLLVDRRTPASFIYTKHKVHNATHTHLAKCKLTEPEARMLTRKYACRTHGTSTTTTPTPISANLSRKIAWPRKMWPKYQAPGIPSQVRPYRAFRKWTVNRVEWRILWENPFIFLTQTHKAQRYGHSVLWVRWWRLTAGHLCPTKEFSFGGRMHLLMCSGIPYLLGRWIDFDRRAHCPSYPNQAVKGG